MPRKKKHAPTRPPAIPKLMETNTPSFPPSGIESLLVKADTFAREQPTKAVASAAGAGLLINLLPLGTIVSTLIAAAFALVRPTLLALGLWKAFDFLREKSAHRDNL